MNWDVRIAAGLRNTSLFPNAQICSGLSQIQIKCRPGALYVDEEQPGKMLTTFLHPASR